jgi:hypothetical protein
VYPSVVAVEYVVRGYLAEHGETSGRVLRAFVNWCLPYWIVPARTFEQVMTGLETRGLVTGRWAGDMVADGAAMDRLYTLGPGRGDREVADQGRAGQDQVAGNPPAGNEPPGRPQ